MSLNKPKSGLIKLDALSDDDSDCWTQWERDALTMQIIPVRRAVQKLAGGARGRRVHFPTMAPGDTDFHLNDSYFHKPHWDDLSDGFFDTKYAFD